MAASGTKMAKYTTRDFREDAVRGTQGENLSRELLKRNHISVENLPKAVFPLVISVSARVKELTDLLALRDYEGYKAWDEAAGDTQILLNELSSSPSSADWLKLLDAEGETGKKDTADFHTELGSSAEVKREMYCFSRSSFNLCFEYANGDKEPSGIMCEHDYFSVVVCNETGDPIFVTYDRTPRLRRLVKAWQAGIRPWTETPIQKLVGPTLNSWSVMLWLPHYLSNSAPHTPEE